MPTFTAGGGGRAALIWGRPVLIQPLKMKRHLYTEPPLVVRSHERIGQFGNHEHAIVYADSLVAFVVAHGGVGEVGRRGTWARGGGGMGRNVYAKL